MECEFSFSNLFKSNDVIVKESKKTFTLGEYKVWDTPIGNGTFSLVYKGFRVSDKTVVAIKKIAVNKKNNINRIKFEIDVMRSLDNNHIVKLMDIMEEPGEIYLVLEYCSGGTLDKYIENNSVLDESKIHHYMTHLRDGLKYLRKMKILHRDLKPHNLLITDDDILKISDFGLSTSLDNQKMATTLCGSPLYMAPEIMLNNVYGVGCDLWSIGVILYQLIYGRHPYNANTIYELIKEINTKEIEFPNTGISKNCQDLLKGLLIVDSNKRLNWGQFFNHSWFNNEYTTRTHCISQPIMIEKKNNNLGSIIIKDYNPSYYNYNQISSEPQKGAMLKNSDIKKRLNNPRNKIAVSIDCESSEKEISPQNSFIYTIYNYVFNMFS